MPATAPDVDYIVEVAAVFTLLDKLERDTRLLMNALDDLRKRVKELNDA
jgi:hypothetical protein